MKLLGRGFGLRAEVPSKAQAVHPWWYPSSGSSFTRAGRSIGVEDMLKVGAFQQGIRLISQTIGMTPVSIFRRLDERNKRRESAHPVHQTVHGQPSPYWTAMGWKQRMTFDAIAHGNGFSRILWDGSVPRKLVPLSAPRTRVEAEDNGEPIYIYTKKDGKEDRIAFDDMFHLPGFGDGFVGQPITRYAAETIALALSLEEHASRYFSDGAEPGGFLEKEGPLHDDTRQRLEGSFQNKAGGVGKHHKWIMLEEGIKANRVGLSNVESQFIEARRFIIEEAGRWLDLPPHVLGELTRAIKSNIEEQSRELVMFRLLPWYVKWEQTIRRDLIFAPEVFFAEFTVDMLLRGDTKARWEAYKIGLEHGIWNPDEIRAKENANPREDGRGNKYWMPLNFTTAGAIAEGGDGGQEPDMDDDEAMGRPVVLVLSNGPKRQALQLPAGEPAISQSAPSNKKALAIAEASAERLVKKEISAIERWASRFDDRERWRHWLKRFYKKHASALVEGLKIDAELADDYCELGMQEVLEKGPEVIEAWIPRRTEQLTSIAIGEAA